MIATNKLLFLIFVLNIVFPIAFLSTANAATQDVWNAYVNRLRNLEARVNRLQHLEKRVNSLQHLEKRVNSLQHHLEKLVNRLHSIEQRVILIERILQSQRQSDLLVQIQQLQTEIQKLRGKLQVQAHTLKILKLNQHQQAPINIENTASSQLGNDAAGPKVPMTASSRLPNSRIRPQISPAEQEAEKEEYQRAYGMLQANEYRAAAQAFRNFLIHYPNSKYSDNAQYWLGETYYVIRNFDAAILEFNQLLDQYPNSPKRAGALLKLGFIYQEKNQNAKATQLFLQITQQYPDSKEAQLAQQRLDLISK